MMSVSENFDNFMLSEGSIFLLKKGRPQYNFVILFRFLQRRQPKVFVWSSSEYNSNNSWILNMNNGNRNNNNKYNNNYVRSFQLF